MKKSRVENGLKAEKLAQNTTQSSQSVRCKHFEQKRIKMDLKRLEIDF